MDKYLRRSIGSKPNKENESTTKVIQTKMDTEDIEIVEVDITDTPKQINKDTSSNDPEKKSAETVVNDKTDELASETECMVLTSDSDSKDSRNSNEEKNNKNDDKESLPKTPSNVRSKSSSLSSSKKKLTPAMRLDEEKRKEQKLKLEEERKKRKAEEEERKLKRKAEEEERKEQRLKLEEEKKKRKAEEEERKTENRRKLEELRHKREEEKLKREEEKIKQMEEKLKRDAENELQKKERLEKERLKNEEKRLREEEKQKEEEEKRRKADMVKNQFSKFFIKIDKPKTEEFKDENNRFMSFQLKENMTLAPTTRRKDIDDIEEFSKVIDNTIAKSAELTTDEQPNYLKEIRKNPTMIRKQTTSSRKIKPTKTNKPIDESRQTTVEYLTDENSVQCMEEIKMSLDNDHRVETQRKMRAKYLHFDKKTYRRPPYFGTWSKKSKFIRPRNPFAMDEKLIDYEVDSDDEWEEIADGESIADSDKGDEEEDKLGEDDEDDGFLVPHGHLSDDELDEDERNLDPELKRAREAAKTEQWETEQKKSSKYIIPRCYFAPEYWNLPESAIDSAKDAKHLKHLERLEMAPFLRNISDFPIEILTDKKLEQDKQAKIAADLAVKQAKQAANLEANSSPTTTPKPKPKKKLSENNMTGSPLATIHPPPTPPKSNMLLKFVSKMSNKNVICKAETNNKKQESIDESDNSIMILSTKPPLPGNKIENSPKPSLIKSSSVNTPNGPLSANKSTPNKPSSLINSALQTTPVSSPKVINNTTAEKRANSSTGETIVKRMKLDQGTSSEKTQTTPNIATVFNNCRKNLQLHKADEANSPVQLVKKQLTGSKRDSLDTVIDTVARGDLMDADKMDTDAEIVQNNENSACIVIE